MDDFSDKPENKEPPQLTALPFGSQEGRRLTPSSGTDSALGRKPLEVE